MSFPVSHPKLLHKPFLGIDPKSKVILEVSQCVTEAPNGLTQILDFCNIVVDNIVDQDGCNKFFCIMSYQNDFTSVLSFTVNPSKKLFESIIWVSRIFNQFSIFIQTSIFFCDSIDFGGSFINVTVGYDVTFEAMEVFGNCTNLNNFACSCV